MKYTEQLTFRSVGADTLHLLDEHDMQLRTSTKYKATNKYYPHTRNHSNQTTAFYRFILYVTHKCR